MAGLSCMFCFTDLDKVLGCAYEGKGSMNVDARRLSPPLTLAVTFRVALSCLAPLSLCFPVYVTEGWTGQPLFLPSLKLSDPTVLVLSAQGICGGM